MGDVAMTVPVLRVFAHTYPEVKLTVVSRPFFKPLFEGIPKVDFLGADVHGKHKGLGLINLAKEAEAMGIDAVADLHSVIRSKIISNYLRVKGFPVASIDKGRKEKKELIQNKRNNFHQLTTTHTRYAAVFEKLGFPLDLRTYRVPGPKTLSPRTNAVIGVESKKLVGIAPFAAHAGKMYPLDLMEKVIDRLNASEKYRIFLFGGEKEKTTLKKLSNSFSNVVNVAGTLNFMEELSLISNLDIMVSMDSGNGHLAAIFGVPVITLWGVTHPYAGFAPFNQPQSHQLTADRQKFPLIPTSIYGNKYPKGYEDSMRTISPETTVGKIREVLS